MNNQSNFREVSPEQLTFLQLKLDWSDINVRVALAFNGIALNVLLNDHSAQVRQAVAIKHYGLDVLANDPHGTVRAAVRIVREEQTYQEAKKITNDIFREAGCL